MVAELRTLRGKTDNEQAAVFRGRACGHITDRQARRIVCCAGLEALGRSISPHVLRHSHATNALEGGAPIPTWSSTRSATLPSRHVAGTSMSDRAAAPRPTWVGNAHRSVPAERLILRLHLSASFGRLGGRGTPTVACVPIRFAALELAAARDSHAKRNTGVRVLRRSPSFLVEPALEGIP